MITKFCIKVLIRRLLKADDDSLDGLIAIDDKKLSSEEVLKYLSGELVKGFLYIPRCSHETKTGECLGHEKANK